MNDIETIAAAMFHAIPSRNVVTIGGVERISQAEWKLQPENIREVFRESVRRGYHYDRGCKRVYRFRPDGTIYRFIPMIAKYA